jgi:lipoprotein-anchoring transpeptidase ErfK/SrfK
MRKVRVGVVAAMLVAGPVVSLAWADQRQSERLAPAVRVGGVDVGGLTRQEALERAWSDLRRPTMRSVRVRVGGRTHTLTAEDARVRLRLPAAVERAHARGRKGHLLARGWRTVKGERIDHDVPVRPAVSTAAIGSFVERIEREVERPARDARLKIAVDGVSATRERHGRSLADAAALRKSIVDAFTRPGARRRLSASVRRVEPEVTRSSLWASTPVVVTVSRTDRRVRLFRRGEPVASFRVAVGEADHPTPTGLFRVQTMQRDPVWRVPDSEWAGELAGRTIPAGDPRNALVARWIGFNGPVGFHGTRSLDSLGRAASRGCVRMSREDVISLYGRVTIGTPVLVGP